MPLGKSQRTLRRGSPACHTSCEPVAADPPWWNRGIDYGGTMIVAAVAFLLYWSTVYADFAYDDSRAIKTNQDLSAATPISQLFINDFWGTPLIHSGSHKSYRPLCVLTFRLNYYLGELDPWGYHLTNVILHVVVSVIFTRLAGMVFLKHTISTMVAGLLFALHPIHTEAVAGVVGRADVGACLFFLICLRLYIKYCDYRDRYVEKCSRRWIYLYSSILCATVAMLWKEHGVTVLAVCAVYDALIHHKITVRQLFDVAFEKRFHGLREGLCHIGATAVILLGMRMHLMGSTPPNFSPADNPAADSDSFITRTLTFLYLPAFNFGMLLYPRWLSFDWSMDSIPLLTSIWDSRNLVSVLFYGILFGISYLLVKFLNKRPYCDTDYNQSAYCATIHEALALRYDGSINEDCCNCISISHRIASFLTKRAQKHYKRHIHNGQMNGHHKSNGHGHGHHRSNGHRNHNNNNNYSHNNNARQVEEPQVDVDPWKFQYACKCCWSPFTNVPEIVVFSLALIVFPFVPATNLFFYVGFVIAERVLYIPSMGFCLLVGLGAEHIYYSLQSVKGRRVFLSFIALSFIMLSARTVSRNNDWKNEENLYRSGIEVNPPKAYGNLANILSSQGKKVEAEIAYKTALSFRANMADVRYNLGILLQEQARYEEAMQSYRLAIQFRPRLAMAHLNLGLILGILGQKDEAAQVYRHCAEIDSTGLKDPKMHESTRISALFNLGRLYADEGKYKLATEIYLEAVRKMPEHYQAQSLFNMMGEAYFMMGSYEDAERWYLEALRQKPDHIPAHLTYAKLLAKWNRSGDAEKLFIRARRLAPNDSNVYQHYGQYLSEMDRHEEAARVYVAASELVPDEYEVVFNAANALRQSGNNTAAEKFYQMSVKLRPDDVTSHMNLGAMLHVNGKLYEAEAAYMEALKLKPYDLTTQNNLVKLRNLLRSRERKARRARGEKVDEDEDEPELPEISA